MSCSQPTGAEALTAPAPKMPGEAFTRVLVTVDASLVILLAFAFAFGNGWRTARTLGVNPYIAPLTQPAVDLAVVGLMVGIRYLAIHGWTDKELAKPRWWLRLFGLLTLVMNCALAVYQHQWGRAGWDAVGPVLLIAWSELAPWLLRAIYSVRAQQAPVTAATAPEPEPVVLTAVPPVPSGEPTNVLDFRNLGTREIARHYIIQWDADGKRYLDGVIRGLEELLASNGRVLTRRRVGQICEKEWDALYREGLVATPRAS